MAIMATTAAALSSAAVSMTIGVADQDLHGYNADVLKQNADEAQKQANRESLKIRKEGKALIGKQRSMYGGAGVSMEGSPLLTMSNTAAAYEEDAISKIYEGKLEAEALREQARSEKYQGKVAKKAGYLKAGSSLLTSAATFATLGGKKQGAK